MQAKDFLLSVRKAETELISVAAQREHYEDMMQAIGAKINTVVVSRSMNTSKTEVAAIGLAELVELLRAKEMEYTGLIQKANELIGKMNQEKFRQVLTLRYLARKSWKTIRDMMDYKDEKSVYRCHGYALKELQKFM